MPANGLFRVTISQKTIAKLHMSAARKLISSGLCCKAAKVVTRQVNHEMRLTVCDMKPTPKNTRSPQTDSHKMSCTHTLAWLISVRMSVGTLTPSNQQLKSCWYAEQGISDAASPSLQTLTLFGIFSYTNNMHVSWSLLQHGQPYLQELCTVADTP